MRYFEERVRERKRIDGRRLARLERQRNPREVDGNLLIPLCSLGKSFSGFADECLAGRLFYNL
ncbi:MAG: hypothetical protein ACI3ZT_07770 [Candidatus Cryptobacteroides sp.]